ncbi:MAG: hypothetical protein IJS47_04610 [Clostridia bacterium]|nr:hypothetical protein [Clostridia bacterium]
MENNDENKIVVKIGKEKVHMELEGLTIEKMWSAGYPNRKWFKVGNKIGLADDTYHVIVSPRYVSVDNFKNEFAVVSFMNDVTGCLEYGHLKPNGKMLNTMRYHWVGQFNENGFAEVADDQFRHFWVDNKGHEYQENPNK